MKLTHLPKVLLLIGACATAGLHADAQKPAAPAAVPLGPLAFLTAHEWEAQLPDSPDGKKMKIHAQFTWAQNRRALRISNQVVADGKAVPYIEGLYAWDPRQHAIVFWYVDAKGATIQHKEKHKPQNRAGSFDPCPDCIRLRRSPVVRVPLPYISASWYRKNSSVDVFLLRSPTTSYACFH
jgi:dipeptidyl aminopeptidase/acylaminoacyl peptidase